MAKRPSVRPRPDVLALLRTCKENPDDDTPRLVLADRLEEHGDAERAEFIRVQCELARGVANTVRREALQTRQSDLWSRLESSWLGRLTITPRRNMPNRDLQQWYFSRGLTWLRISGRTFLSQRMQSLGKTEEWAWVEHLRLTDLTGPLVRRVAACPLLGEVIALELSANNIGDRGVQALAASKFLSHLKRLDLRRNNITDRGAEVLAESARLGGLAHLNLDQNAIWEDGQAMLRDRFGYRVSFNDLYEIPF